MIYPQLVLEWVALAVIYIGLPQRAQIDDLVSTN